MVDQLLELEESHRSAFVERSFSHDPALREWVERLLAGIGSEALLRAPDSEFLSAALERTEHRSPRADELIGTRFGPFRVVSLIGEGGMGRVYLAEREGGSFSQRVALKVMAFASLTDSLRQRFVAEQRALSRLEHPNVARLLDGGVREDGIPWFAMEYVDGARIDEWCDVRRLGVRDRLRLFATVCDAVQAAHQRFVIHRDLKPSNVLVSETGDVRLLDFGVAKLLVDDDGHTDVTRIDERLFTPEYAAPEQWHHEPVTAATDSYALGVMLYQLLCGARPHDLRNRPRHTWMHVVESERPQPPSTRATAQIAELRASTIDSLRRALRGDLDAIVLRALRPEAGARYQTAKELADEVRRYLAAEPVQARQGRWAYRAQRFVRRNRAAVALAASAVLAVGAGSITVAWQARRANRAAAEATAVSRFLASLFAQGHPTEARGDTLTAAEMLARASRGVDSMFPDQPSHRVRVLLTVSGINRDLSRLDQADSLARRALAVVDSFDLDPLERAMSLGMIGSIASARDNLAEADSLITAALTLARRGTAPDTVRARLLDSQSAVFFRMERFAEAETSAREALRLGTDLGPMFGALVTSNIAMAISAQNQETAENVQRVAEADSLYRVAIEYYQRAGMTGHPDYLSTLASRATSWFDRSRPDSARPILAEALTGLERMYGPHHEVVLAAVINLAQADLQLENAEMAESGFERARAQALQVHGPDHFLTVLPLVSIGQAQLIAARPQLAEQTLKRALGQLKTREGIDARLALGAWLALGRSFVAQNRFVEALATNDSAAVIASSMPTSSAIHSEISVDRASALIGLGRPLEAERLARDALSWRRANTGTMHKSIADALFTLARAIHATGGAAKRQEANALAEEAVGHLRQIPWRTIMETTIDSTLRGWRQPP